MSARTHERIWNVTLLGDPRDNLGNVSHVARARLTDDGAPAAELTVDAGTGLVRLDYGRGPVLPRGRLGFFEGGTQPSETIEREILVDCAAVFGSVNGRPLAFLAFTQSRGCAGLRLAAEDAARICRFRLAGQKW